MDNSAENFITLLTINQHKIYAYILSVLASCSDADDIMQETSIIMWRKFDQYRSGTDFVAWGIAIARNVILNARKKRKLLRLSDTVIEALSADISKDSPQMDYRLDALRDCVMRLSRYDRMLLELRYKRDMSMRKIAVLLKRNLRGMYRSFSRIYAALLRCIHGKLIPEDM